MSLIKDCEHLKIPFEKIDAATEKFKTCIGRGGYGWVYKGVLSIDGKNTTVAVKRLNEQFGQGLKEFLTEIQLLFGQEHPNLISLLGYCDDGKEKIIVYEYGTHGSLEKYIRRNHDESSTTLTWLERLKICADAARGLDHLHNHIGGQRMIIHRDIKCSNILIDENWVAKISDLGLSKLSVTGFGMSLIITNGCGTPGYLDPEYYTSGIVTKKSDVYSFGIVLFEVLCGRLCIIEPDNNGFILLGKSVKEYYNKGNLVHIIDPSLREHIGSHSMTRFSEIAYKCLNDDREQRPSMDYVLKELEETLNVHVALAYELEEIEEDIDENWEKRLPHDYPHLVEMSDVPLIYTTKKELYLVFRHGFLANNGQVWFSTCKSTRGICVILPSRRVLFEELRLLYNSLKTLSLPGRESRFKEVQKLGHDNIFIFRCKLESFMFSPHHYNYACYLVFKLEDGHVMPNDGPIFEAQYILDGVTTLTITLNKPKDETGSSKSIDASSTRSWVEKRDDGWLEARLTKPLLKRKLETLEEEFRLDIMSMRGGSIGFNGFIVEGVEFRPVLETSITCNMQVT